MHVPRPTLLQSWREALTCSHSNPSVRKPKSVQEARYFPIGALSLVGNISSMIVPGDAENTKNPRFEVSTRGFLSFPISCLFRRAAAPSTHASITRSGYERAHDSHLSNASMSCFAALVGGISPLITSCSMRLCNAFTPAC